MCHLGKLKQREAVAYPRSHSKFLGEVGLRPREPGSRDPTQSTEPKSACPSAWGSGRLNCQGSGAFGFPGHGHHQAQQVQQEPPAGNALSELYYPGRRAQSWGWQAQAAPKPLAPCFCKEKGTHQMQRKNILLCVYCCRQCTSWEMCG